MHGHLITLLVIKYRNTERIVYFNTDVSSNLIQLLQAINV